MQQQQQHHSSQQRKVEGLKSMIENLPGYKYGVSFLIFFSIQQIKMLHYCPLPFLLFLSFPSSLNTRKNEKIQNAPTLNLLVYPEVSTSSVRSIYSQSPFQSNLSRFFNIYPYINLTTASLPCQLKADLNSGCSRLFFSFLL